MHTNIIVEVFYYDKYINKFELTNIFEMTTKIKIPAANVVQLLNAQGKTPKIARAYSENIVYSHMNGRIYDENVEQAIKELEAPIRKSTLQNA